MQGSLSSGANGKAGMHPVDPWRASGVEVTGNLRSVGESQVDTKRPEESLHIFFLYTCSKILRCVRHTPSPHRAGKGAHWYRAHWSGQRWTLFRNLTRAASQPLDSSRTYSSPDQASAGVTSALPLLGSDVCSRQCRSEKGPGTDPDQMSMTVMHC